MFGWFNKEAKEQEALKREVWLKAHTFIQNEKVKVCPHGEYFGIGRVVSRKTVEDDYSIDHYYEVELELGVVKQYCNSELEKLT